MELAAQITHQRARVQSLEALLSEIKAGRSEVPLGWADLGRAQEQALLNSLLQYEELLLKDLRGKDESEIKWKVIEAQETDERPAQYEVQGIQHGRRMWHATLRFDGCIHLYQASNEPFGAEFGEPGKERKHPASTSYMHLCDVAQLARGLADLSAVGCTLYGDDWKD